MCDISSELTQMSKMQWNHTMGHIEHYVCLSTVMIAFIEQGELKKTEIQKYNQSALASSISWTTACDVPNECKLKWYAALALGALCYFFVACHRIGRRRCPFAVAAYRYRVICEMFDPPERPTVDVEFLWIVMWPTI